jgi:hypothetical protein
MLLQLLALWEIGSYRIIYTYKRGIKGHQSAGMGIPMASSSIVQDVALRAHQASYYFAVISTSSCNNR